MGRREELALGLVRGLVRHPRLADAVFRFDQWGNIMGPDRFTDPYPIYERMRAAGPVSFSPLLQQWAIVGYQEAQEVLRSGDFGVAGQMQLLVDTRPYSRLSARTKALLTNALLFTDPPTHTRLRRAVARSFIPRRIERLEPRVRSITERLLAAIDDDPTPELVASVAEPLPIQVIAEMIGVPEDRWGWIAETSTILRRVVDPFVPLDPAEIDQVADDIVDYCGGLADDRRSDPRDDLLSELAGSEAAGDIDRIELISLVAVLLLAGHETTTGALGNAIVALARHPDQRDLLRERPELWANAIEELLRYDTVLHTDPRQALRDVTIGGRTIKAGQNLTVMLAAANRDPARFPDAHRLRVDREDPAPLSFGTGMHHCLGAALARLELRVALPAIIDSLGDCTIDDAAITWKTSLAFRSPTRLPVRRTRGERASTRSPSVHELRLRGVGSARRSC